MRTKSSISTILTLLMLSPSPAQQTQTSAPAPSGGTVTFKTSSNLVIVNVSAKDKGGLGVEGLKAEDFTVMEDGKVQKISVFEYQRIASKPEPPKDLTLDEQFALPEAPKTTITSSTPGQI